MFDIGQGFSPRGEAVISGSSEPLMTDVGHRRRRQQYHLPLPAYSGEVAFVFVSTTGSTLTYRN